MMSWILVVAAGIIFFPIKKKYINIKRYQLHLAFATTHHPNGTTDAHNQKNEKKTKKQKSRALML
jgi:putative Ca2+/H+ antiporter (TMEM165/GDT1 family)